jgi:hypothetical protein
MFSFLFPPLAATGARIAPDVINFKPPRRFAGSSLAPASSPIAARTALRATPW